MTEVVIAGAVRTAVGAFNGGLSSLLASDLGAVAIRAVLERAGVAGEEVDEVVLGQILTAGAGQNPARQARENRISNQSAMRLGPKDRCPGLSSDSTWGCQNRSCGRAGVDEPGTSRGAFAQRSKNG